MRDITRIPKITEKLMLLWSKNPDLRFFQLMDYLSQEMHRELRDIFYVEDCEIEALLVRKTFKEVPAVEWARIWNIEILDHDGWRGDSNIEEFETKPISEEEFFDRASECTCTGNSMKAFDLWKKKW